MAVAARGLRTAARSTRAKGAKVAATAPRGEKTAVRAGAAQRAARLEQAANLSTITRGSRRLKVRGDVNTGNMRPAVTAMVVIAGAEFLHAWLVESRTLPERRYLTRLAILGFMLALFTEITPKFGRSMSYLIMTAVIFQRSGAILKSLDKNVKRSSQEIEPSPEPGPTLAGDDDATYILYQTGGPAPVRPPVPARVQLRRPQRGVGTAV